ncbi:hypothetical protein [Streptomyces sp. R35]|uniref:Uncharacterized protein n=1 Tax=Streptomyces sp. R35 TaxID=3238630 RepID=A0AB39SC06_9ACTN
MPGLSTTRRRRSRYAPVAGLQHQIGLDLVVRTEVIRDDRVVEPADLPQRFVDDEGQR